MKGKTTARLEKILQDSVARGQLRESLIHGGNGRISVGNQEYVVRTDVQGAVKSSKNDRNPK